MQFRFSGFRSLPQCSLAIPAGTPTGTRFRFFAEGSVNTGLLKPGAAEPESMKPPQRAAQLLRDRLVQNPELKPKAALQILRESKDHGILFWLNSLSNDYDRVRHLLNAERERLFTA